MLSVKQEDSVCLWVVGFDKERPSMNKKQKIVLWIGIAIFGLMGLFPPWVYSVGDSGRIRGYGGRRFIVRDFWSEQPRSSVIYSIDIQSLATEWLIVIGVTGGLFIIFKGKNSTKPKGVSKPESEE
jgi:hypothetical protein